MSTYDTHDHESTEPELDDRTRRALTEYMGVVPEGGEMYTVIGQNHPDRDQSSYTVDLRRGRCSCPDSEYRNATCKHERRVLFATGEVPVPAVFSPGDVAGRLGGDHLDGQPRFLATDGGSVPERARVPVSGGVLVYEQRAVGKELVGFENVTDWSALGNAVAARGHSRGDALHLPELDEGGQ